MGRSKQVRIKMNKVLIIGAGSIGQKHIRALLSIGEKNIAAFRTGKGQLKNLAKDIKEHVKIYQDENAAFAWKPTHVIISNPTNLHLEYLIKTIQLGAKVFVEKPIVHDYTILKNATVSASEIKKYNGVVGFNLRFHGLFKKIKEIISTYQYGNILSANLIAGHYLPFWHPYENYRNSYASRKCLGGGVLRTLCHEIDLAYHLFGKVIKVFARIENLSSLEIDVDDSVDIIINSENCKRIYIHLNYLYPLPLRKGNILFEKGLLEYDYYMGTLFFTDYNDIKIKNIYSTDKSYDKQYIIQMKNFLADKSKAACTLKEGIEEMRIIALCEKSSKNGKEICLN